MRKIFLFIFSFGCLTVCMHGQTFNWVSSNQFGSLNKINGTSCDAARNIYYRGTYSNPCQHCSSPPPGGWFAKYTRSNNLIWQDTVNNIDWLKGITNANGDFFITGNFWSSARFGQYFLSSTDTAWNLQGGRHGFIAKYNSSGVCQWAKIIPYASCNDIAVNGNNIFITGFGSHSGNKVSMFDNIPLDSTKNLFVAKYSDTGQIIWVKGFSHGIGLWEKNLINVNDSTIYLSGRLGTGGGFATKLKINGDSLWTKSAPACPCGITVNNQNELYCVGFFSGIDTINNVQYGNANANYSGYLIRFDINGNVTFVKAVSPHGSIPVFYFSAIDFNDGNLYVTAPLESGTIIFDGDTVSALTNAGAQLVIFKMNESGKLIWENILLRLFNMAALVGEILFINLKQIIFYIYQVLRMALLNLIVCLLVLLDMNHFSVVSFPIILL